VKFTIGKKIGFGFGVVIILTIVAFVFTNITLKDSKKKTDNVVKVVTPSVAALNDFNLLLESSQRLISKWVNVQSVEDEIFKLELKDLIVHEYPLIKSQIDSLSITWTKEEKVNVDSIFKFTDNLFLTYQNEIMSNVTGFSSYDDAQVMFPVKVVLEETETNAEIIHARLYGLIESQKSHAVDVTKEMFKSFSFLQEFVKWLGVALVVGGIFVAMITIRTIVKPVKTLKEILKAMSLGIIPNEKIPNRSDEIGDMSKALNGLIGALESTTEFANQVGSGNFSSAYEPLSEHDDLGHALIKMRYNLAENERILEQKVIERTEEVVRQKEEIMQKTTELELLFTQVTDSIRYAKRIQEAILPPESYKKKILPKSFILYKPKEMV